MFHLAADLAEWLSDGHMGVYMLNWLDRADAFRLEMPCKAGMLLPWGSRLIAASAFAG